MSARPVVVVGTTADYIAILAQRHPGQALFITDPLERQKSAESAPAPGWELLCNLGDYARTLARLREHLLRKDQWPAGVACFDCESLGLAAVLARELGLPFPSPEAVAASRSKLRSKQLWQRAGVACPQCTAVASSQEADRLPQTLGAPLIMKPQTGSGSELVFLCADPAQCRQAFAALQEGLASHPNRRLYPQGGDEGPDPRRVFVAEQFIAGDEYSCDFLVEEGRARIIRLARKYAATDQPVGTIQAYLLPAPLPAGLSWQGLTVQLEAAALALGLSRAIGMADLMVAGGAAYLIELTPRPGGDCLPPLIERSSGLDMLGLTLDFAAGRPIALPAPEQWQTLVGLRLFARQEGVIRRLDAGRLGQDRRVRECSLRRGPGDRVVLPPRDYDSRLLGQVIFAPTPGASVEQQCQELEQMLVVEMEPAP
ncbi:MAG: ATP-grasp domain-containing protein [Desulfarculus sp.]|nr:MAG: ATP-grasp domain-containing protein [Desulfarculus sp.]